jgi:hypothetical protein
MAFFFTMPNEDLLCVSVDAGHLADLTIPFRSVCLINADCVNPFWSEYILLTANWHQKDWSLWQRQLGQNVASNSGRHIQAPQVQQSIMKILS